MDNKNRNCYLKISKSQKSIIISCKEPGIYVTSYVFLNSLMARRIPYLYCEEKKTKKERGL